MIWQLRTSYLTHIKDGVGERLINVDSGILNDPSFKAAGWTANIADIKRTYSPPIPTAITSDYFAAPQRNVGLAPTTFLDEEEEGGMVTGRRSTDTVGPGPITKRRRRREQQEEDDSSDLSDESDDDIERMQRAAQQIKFAKMPVRNRSGSSPIRSSVKDGPELFVTSPSKPSGDGRLRRGSLGAVEAIKQRARTDTTTSSEFSSENDLDPSVFRRREINSARSVKPGNFLDGKFGAHSPRRSQDGVGTIDEDPGEDSYEGSLSSEFAEAADSGSSMEDVSGALTSSPLMEMDMPAPLNINPPSPKKSRSAGPATLQALPPARPISTIVPMSALGQAIRARQSKPKNPTESFARFSGKGVPDPLNIRIYAPFSETPSKPFDMPLQRIAPDSYAGDKLPVSVADAIGLSLWRYYEEGIKPPIPRSKLDVNRWTLRMVEDGEVEMDFPALTRTSAISDFASNNNRAARGRSRGKVYDEFALVEATDSQFKANQKLTPRYTTQANEMEEEPTETSPHEQKPLEEKQAVPSLRLNTILDSPFSAASRKPTATLADKPLPTSHSTPRMGPPKLLKIHFTSLEAYSQTTTVEVTTDTYIAEVLDTVCKRMNLEKAHHFLRVTGTSTVAPLDRTVESIGNRTELDLIRRRFAHDGGMGITGSPGSSSPNAPLFLPTETTPTKKGKKTTVPAHPLSQKQDLWGNTTNYKKYTVIRKQPMSFTPSHQRTLLMDGDYMHILPGETGKTLFDTSAKTTTIPFSMIVGCKVGRRHPKTFRVFIFREKETKRYDFEAQNATEAAEIVEEIRKGMEPFRTGFDGV